MREFLKAGKMFFALFLYVIGAIGGTCYLIADGHEFPAIGVIVASILAWPKAVKYFKALWG